MTKNTKTKKTAQQPSFHTSIRLSDTTSFKKSFLKNGWGVKTRNGQWFTVTKITGYGTAFVNNKTSEVFSARQWDAFMKNKTDKDFDIVMAAQPCDMEDFMQNNFNNYIVVYAEKARKRKKKPVTVSNF